MRLRTQVRSHWAQSVQAAVMMHLTFLPNLIGNSCSAEGERTCLSPPPGTPDGNAELVDWKEVFLAVFEDSVGHHVARQP